jgi:putative endonuclease
VNNCTSHGIPWELVISYQVNTRSEAMILEKEIKKRGIGRFLKDHQT